MKNLPTYKDFLNEGLVNEKASWGVDVQEPFSDKDERKAQDKFAIKVDPITIVGSSGVISEEETDVSVQFSNGEMIDYYWSQMERECTITIKPHLPQKYISEKDLDKYLGSTGTIIGDMALIYRDYKAGKIK